MHSESNTSKDTSDTVRALFCTIIRNPMLEVKAASPQSDTKVSSVSRKPNKHSLHDVSACVFDARVLL